MEKFTLVEKNGHKGIYIGDVEDKPVIVALEDAEEEMSWDKAMSYAKDIGERLPTQRELMLMFVHQNKLNEALEAAGGKPWETGWYWSSSEYNSNGAWVVHASGGSVDWNSKYAYAYYVRCVLA